MSFQDNPLDLPRPVGYDLLNGISERTASIDHQHNIQIEDWKYLSDIYENSWVDYDLDGTATPFPVEAGRYCLLPTGFVFCQGTIKDGTVTDGTVLWTFPSGYRPRRQISFACLGGTTLCRIDVLNDGSVVGVSGLSSTDTEFFLYFEADRDTFTQSRS